MNLSKIIYSIVLAVQVSVSAGSSSVAEDSSASAIRELIAKVDSYKTEVDDLKASHKTEIDALKAKIDILESNDSSATKPRNNVRRAQWAPPAPENPPEIPNDIPLDISDLSQADMQDIISSLGTDEQLSGVLYGLIHTVNKLVGLANCVSYDGFEDACIIGSQNVDYTHIIAGEDVEIDAPDDVYINSDYVYINSDYVDIYASVDVDIEAGDDVYIKADDDVDIEAGYDVYIEAGDDIDIDADDTLEMYSEYQGVYATEYVEINGDLFFFNPNQHSAIDGDKPASDGEEDDNSAKAKAKFDAKLVEKGYAPIFNVKSP